MTEIEAEKKRDNKRYRIWPSMLGIVAITVIVPPVGFVTVPILVIFSSMRVVEWWND